MKRFIGIILLLAVTAFCVDIVAPLLDNLPGKQLTVAEDTEDQDSTDDTEDKQETQDEKESVKNDLFVEMCHNESASKPDLPGYRMFFAPVFALLNQDTENPFSPPEMM